MNFSLPRTPAANVFTYGSLMFDVVWRRIVQGSYACVDASLPGATRRSVKGEHYPALILTDNAAKAVAGRLYVGVSPRDLLRLDAFEGLQYRRATVEVISTQGVAVPAQVYLWRARFRHLLSDREWSLSEFERIGLQRFLKQYQGFIDRE